MLVSMVLSIIAILTIVLTLYGFNIDYKMVELVGTRPLNVNLFFGIENDINQYRSNSFFTETNKFGYFLSPALMVMFFLRKKRVIYYVFFCILLLTVVSTFSFVVLFCL